MAETLDRRTLVLHPDLERVQGLADVGDGDVPHDRDVAGSLVYLGLNGGAVELEERGRPAQRMVGFGFLAGLSISDQLAT